MSAAAATGDDVIAYTDVEVMGETAEVVCAPGGYDTGLP